jgi:hypothetical protein
MSQKLAHPMEKFQRQVRSRVETNVIKPTDRLWQIALLYGNDWAHWKKELHEFGFSMDDPVVELLQVEAWDED